MANGFGLRISPKNSIDICKMIKGKSPEQAIKMLSLVEKFKKVVKMHGREVPHKKGKGIAGARYPITAAKIIRNVVSQLKANAIVNGIESPVITIAMANFASAPRRRGGVKAKRTNLHLEARDKTKLIKPKK